MLYKPYGQTGKKVSILGFGGMRFAEPHNLDTSIKTVLKAFELGINYFDTAPLYTDDKSEIIMGHAIREMKKSKKPFFISTKSGKSNASELMKDLEKSLKRLNLNTIDFFHCWCLLSLEAWEKRKTGGAIKALLHAQKEGLIRHVCFSTHLAGQEIQQVLDEEIFEGVTLGYSAINFAYREKGLHAAANKKLGVVVMNPLGGGVIANNPDYFSFIKVRDEQTIIDAALHFLFSQDPITVTLVGFRNEQDVEAAIQAVNTFIPYSPDQMNGIKNKINQDFNSLCTTCMYCNICPENIPVWKFIETCNHTLLKGGESVFARIKWHWSANIEDLDKCTGCKRCEAACTQHLPILERFKTVKDTYLKELQERVAKSSRKP